VWGEGGGEVVYSKIEKRNPSGPKEKCQGAAQRNVAIPYMTKRRTEKKKTPRRIYDSPSKKKEAPYVTPFPRRRKKGGRREEPITTTATLVEKRERTTF